MSAMTRSPKRVTKKKRSAVAAARITAFTSSRAKYSLIAVAGALAEARIHQQPGGEGDQQGGPGRHEQEDAGQKSFRPVPSDERQQMAQGLEVAPLLQPRGPLGHLICELRAGRGAAVAQPWSPAGLAETPWHRV
jgi:hypothetical protein